MTNKNKQRSKVDVSSTRPKHWRRLRGLARRWRNWSLRKRVVVVCVTVVITLAILFGLLVAFVVAALVGFPYNLVKDIDPQSQHIVSARTEAEAGVDREGAALMQEVQLKPYTKVSDDGCYEGQNNYKHTDGYVSRCSYTTTYYYGVGADYKATLQKIEQNLKVAKWEEPPSREDTIVGAIDWYQYRLDNPSPDLRPSIVIGSYTKASSKFMVRLDPKDSRDREVRGPNSSLDNKKTFEDIAKENDFVVTITITNIYASKPSLKDGLL